MNVYFDNYRLLLEIMDYPCVWVMVFLLCWDWPVFIGCVGLLFCGCGVLWGFVFG